MGRHKKDFKAGEDKKKKHDNYLKRKALNSKQKDCSFCGKKFLSYMRTISCWTLYCSVSCAAKKQWANQQKTMIKKNNERDNEDSKLLREYWVAYHDTLISLEDVLDLKIMRERFISNKAYDRYDLFVPSNLL